MTIKPASRLSSINEYYFSRKLQEIAKMKSAGLDVINLGIGSPDLMPSDYTLAEASVALEDKNSHGYSSYRSLPELRKAMSNWLQKFYQISLDPESEILPLLGSKEGILYLSMAILNPGDKVLIPDPGYPAYTSSAILAGARIMTYPLTEESDWLPDLSKLREQDLCGVKLMWINYPHMPTGACANNLFFSELIQFAKENNILLCNDNPYGLILNEDLPLSLLKYDPELEVSCELNSLSKCLNMAGWRVGMFLGHKVLVDSVMKVKSQVDSGMFLPVQKGAIAALKEDEHWHEVRNNIYKERRRYIYEILDLLGFKYQKNQNGLFIWAKVHDEILNVEKYLDDILQRAHVFFVPGVIFGKNGERYVRISLCASEEMLKEAIKRVRTFVS